MSKIAMLEENVKNQKRKMLVFNTEPKPGSDNEESDGSGKEDGNRKHSTLTRQGKSKRSRKVCGQSVDSCIKLAAICIIKVGIFEAATSSQSNESTT